MELFLVIFVGLCFGSFITMASYRLPRDKSIIMPCSRCPKCDNALTGRDLVPVLSWLISHGKCRHCKNHISVRYPLIEIVTAAVFAFIYSQFGLGLEAIIIALFSVALLIMIFADLETKIIPDEIHIALLILGVIYHWQLATPLMNVIGCVIFAGGLGLVLHYGYYFIRKRHGLGFGDVKFLFVVGLWLASPHQFAAFIFYSGVLGVITGIIWQFISKDPRFPFGPSLAISLFILVVWPASSQLFWNTISLVLR